MSGRDVEEVARAVVLLIDRHRLEIQDGRIRDPPRGVVRASVAHEYRRSLSVSGRQALLDSAVRRHIDEYRPVPRRA